MRLAFASARLQLHAAVDALDVVLAIKMLLESAKTQVCPFTYLKDQHGQVMNSALNSAQGWNKQCMTY